METINSILSDNKYSNIIISVIVIIICYVFYRIINYILKKSEKYGLKLFTSTKGKTYLRMIKSLTRFIFLITTILIVLQVNGVNVGSMLAGVGILSVIIGFAVQDTLKDILGGLDIIYDSYFQIGDVINYEGIEGKVISIGIKTTKIQDVRTQNTISIANRNIQKVEVVSNLINIDLPMHHEVNIIEAEKVIKEILSKINELEHVEKTEYKGVSEINDWCIKYRIFVFCDSIYKVQTTRDAQRCIIVGYNEAGIEVPYNQIQIHQK